MTDDGADPRRTSATDGEDTATDLSEAEVRRGRDLSEVEKEPRAAPGAPEGDSRPSSATAPPSAGEMAGSEGVVDPERGPDLRPSHAREAPTPETAEETPVPRRESAAPGSARTGSAGSAALDAGSAPPGGEEGRPETAGREEEPRDDRTG